ncbi:PREDICTED: probable serine/threonine-protein kinase nek3 [Ceratosolen solmsi marchali]|uniref:Probable serine/threonine-protein kinase nek3 n=1 Tax=Ceratosolen solmsi marchali TaxID=326594 RepID=A0AAJ6YCD8_9HYME|nr:PREDICTED: probable serine/threonine-protein kinase nek3 [Ceratosolen solmsi marchali]
MTHNISSDLHDKQMNNLTNVALIEKEKKFLSNEQQVGNPVQQLQTKQLEKEKSEGVQIEDMILSLCEQYDKRHILTQTVEDNSILLVNELVSSSSESCKNQTTIISPFDMPSRLTSNKNMKNDSQTNLSTLKNCNKPSTSKSSSSKSSNSQFTIHSQSNGKNKYKVYNEDSLNNKTIVKCSNNFTSNLNNISNSTNILGDTPKENVFKEATATNPLNAKVSVIYPNTNLQATSNKSLNSDSNENSEIENCIPSKDSSIKELENQVSVIKNTQPIDNISCPIIFEVSIPSAQEQSENDYDLLKNININLVDEIDVIRDTSMTNSSNFNSPEKTFKLRDINELLEKPEKLSGPKKVTLKNKNSTDKRIPPPILLLSDAASSNTPFLPEMIADVDENNLSTTNSSDKFKALANLINNISPMPHYSQLQTICCNIEQPTLQNSKFNNLSSSSAPVTKNNSNSNMQLSYQQVVYNALPGCSYSASKPGMSQALENLSQNNCTLFNNNSQSTTPVHPSANMNGNNRKVVLASSIYSNFYAQDTVFTLDLPPLQTLAILIPYIVNMQESSDSINKKIIEYKKMLLNKLVYELKALDKIVLHKRKQYINALLNFNTLTENTWKFQLIIITIIQCVFSLTNLTTKVNYHKVIQAIVNSINPKPSNQLLSTLNSILKLYYYFKQKGINCGYSDRRQPLLLELEEMNNKYQPNTINTMTDHQKREFITQTKIYRKISQIHALQLQVPAGDHNLRDDYQKIDEIDSSLIIPLQQNITNNSIEIINSLQNSSLKNKTQVSSISNKMIEGHQDKSNNFLISSNPISSLSNDAANTSNKKSKNEAINETFPGEKEYNINHLCLKCRKLSQIVCSNCKIATYCSRDCQQNHWKEKHYKICKKI